MPGVALLAQPTPQPAGALQRAFARLAGYAVLAHALFLPISVAGMQIALGVAAVALVALQLCGRPAWSRSSLDLPTFLLVGAAVASLGLGALGGSPPVGWHEATLWRALLSAPVLLSAIEASRASGAEDDPSAPQRLALVALATWALAALVPSAIAWVQYWTGLDPLHALGLRDQAVRAPAPWYPGHYAAVGFFRWYQRLAHDLTPPLLLAAAVAISGGLARPRRLLLAIASGAAAAAVVLTLSRAAWVSLALGAMTLAALSGRMRRWALPAVVALSLALALHPAVRARLAHLAVAGDNDDRKHIWHVCRAVIEDHPLTGVGWGNLPRRSGPYYDRIAPWNPLRAWCHDSFLSAWAEGGPLLLAALTAWWALLLRAFWRWRASARTDLARGAAGGGLAALAAMLANSLVHDILYSSEAMYALMAAVGVAAALARARPAPPSGAPPSASAG